MKSRKKLIITLVVIILLILGFVVWDLKLYKDRLSRNFDYSYLRNFVCTYFTPNEYIKYDESNSPMSETLGAYGCHDPNRTSG